MLLCAGTAPHRTVLRATSPGWPSAVAAANRSPPRATTAAASPMPARTAPACPAGAATSAGRRGYQHDRVLVHRAASPSPYLLTAVFDGHGAPESGHLVSALLLAAFPAALARSLARAAPPGARGEGGAMRAALAAAVAEGEAASHAESARARVYAGSTLCAVVAQRGRVVCANVGDSRALLVALHPATGGVQRVAPLSRDHVAASRPEEVRRVRAAGGWVDDAGCVNGHISMTRSIGDQDLKEHRNLTQFPPPPRGAGGGGKTRFAHDLIVATPEFVDAAIEDGVVTVVVVASDGVWGRLKDEKVAAVVAAALRRGRGPEKAAQAVVQASLRRGAIDNVSAVVSVVGDGGIDVCAAWGATEAGERSPRGVASRLRRLVRRRDTGSDARSPSVQSDASGGPTPEASTDSEAEGDVGGADRPHGAEEPPRLRRLASPCTRDECRREERHEPVSCPLRSTDYSL